jgi:hypothetical protein
VGKFQLPESDRLDTEALWMVRVPMDSPKHAKIGEGKRHALTDS